MCLSLKDENVNSFNLKNRFYDSIRLYKPGGHRSTICQSILEKSNIMFTGIYDSEDDPEEVIKHSHINFDTNGSNTLDKFSR